MEITIERNKLHNNSQTFDLDENVTTFIGGNGCGKSTLLRSIFTKYIDNKDFNIISFSSGQNELFTALFNEHKKKNKRFTQKEENELINSFYFNYDWARTLIYFASILKPEGNVRSFLVENGYVKVNNLRDDISSRFKFTFRIRQNYKIQITRDYEHEASDKYVFGETKLIRKTAYHETIERIISTFGYNFSFDDGIYNSIRKKTIELDFNTTNSVFPNKDPFSIFTFWALATTGWGSFFEISETRLRFENDMEFRSLSDGEYQLLSVYALMDLFDKENTIFLFDEIDSHLYYRNIEKLWSYLKTGVKGKVITTTHIADSLIQNNYSSLRIVDNGKILSDSVVYDLKERLQNFSNSTDYYFKLISNIEYIALVEDDSDWIIFKILAKIKLAESYDSSKIDKIQIVKCFCGYESHGQIFGQSKIKWVEDLIKVNRTFNTKTIFMICDRDNYPINNIKENNGVQITGNSTIKFNNSKGMAYLLSWKRREIENYLLSYSMLLSYNKIEEINYQLAQPYQLIENSSMDIKQIQELEIKTKIQSLYVNGNRTRTINNPEGIDFEKLEQVLSKIPASEISDDIRMMYNFITNKIT